METLIWPAVVAFLVCLAVGPVAIPALQKLKFGQVIRQEGPQSHQSKKGTPTMGGFIFLFAAIVTTVMFIRHWDPHTVMAAVCILGFAVIGFLDDFIKVIRKRNLGLRAWQKLVMQLALSILIAIYAYRHIGTSLQIPFWGGQWDLGIWYIPFIVFVLVGAVNSVNLTDGLDGLCGGVALIYFAAYALIFTTGLIPGAENFAIISSILAGSCLGFLRFNVFPARVFMGDTGSLALGGAVAYVAIVSHTVLWLPIMAGVFIASTVSDIIQVVSYKTRKKRVFKMAPLHHHFELLGMPETRVVSMYMIVTTILCLIGLIA